MSDWGGDERRKDHERLEVILRQVQNAGFDLDTVDGQNRFRQALEFSSRSQRRCENAAGELTKYGALLIAAAVVSLLVAGFWDHAKVMVSR